MDSVEPLLKSPFTDVFGHLVDSQFLGRCADLEIDSYNCAEAYGLGKTGREKCFNLIEDLKECITYKLQTKRFLAMRMERHRQYFRGKRTKDNRFSAPPPVNSY